RRVRHWHSPVEAEVAVAAEPGIANPLRMPDQSAIERKLPVPAAWVSFGVVGVRRRYHVWRTADDGRVVRGLVADRPAISAPIVVEIASGCRGCSAAWGTATGRGVVEGAVSGGAVAAESAAAAGVIGEPLVPAIHPAIPGRGTALVEAVIGPEPAPVIGRGDGAHPVLGDVRAGGQGGHHDQRIHANAPIRAGGWAHRHR